MVEWLLWTNSYGIFKTPGLTKMGNNLYTASVNLSEATLRSGIGSLGEDNSKGYGDALQGMLVLQMSIWLSNSLK